MDISQKKEFLYGVIERIKDPFNINPSEIVRLLKDSFDVEIVSEKGNALIRDGKMYVKLKRKGVISWKHYDGKKWHQTKEIEKSENTTDIWLKF